jgi:hypothetical protein
MQSFFFRSEQLLANLDSLLSSSNAVVERVHEMDSLTLINNIQLLKTNLITLLDAVHILQQEGLSLPIQIR